MDKNEFRYIEEGDIIKVSPKKQKWYHEVIDFIKEEVRLLMELIK